MIQPVVKRIINVAGVSVIRGPFLILLIQVNVPTSSAVPKTAGITVEKLREDNKKYSTPDKYSSPT
jgi:hypothetical protein